MNGRVQTEAGLTLTELLIALSILAVILTVALTAYLSSLRINSDASLRSRAAPLLTAVAGRIASHALSVPDGESVVQVYAPSSVNVPLTLNPTPTSCATYLQQNTSNACVTVSNTSSFSPVANGKNVLDAPMDLYTANVCWRKSGTVNCASSTTPY